VAVHLHLHLLLLVLGIDPLPEDHLLLLVSAGCLRTTPLGEESTLCVADPWNRLLRLPHEVVLLHWLRDADLLLACLIEKGVVQGVLGRDTLRVVELEHFIEQVESLLVMDLARLAPGDFLLLHLVWDQAPIPVLEGDLFDGVGAEEADKRDQIRYREVLDLATVI